VQAIVLSGELVFALDVIGILGDAIGRADQLALRAVMSADALGATSGIDNVEHVASRDGCIGAG
jgi:5,10-methenyltetrahydromethanopterin hydrogenase